MKVLLTSASFAASYGGPAYSVRRLAEELAVAGLNVGIWAPDGSAARFGAKTVREECREPRPRELTGPLAAAIGTFGIPDLFHDSGLWWRHNREIAAAAGRYSKPLVVSVRGMLEPAALKHRAWKKLIAWHLYQKRILNHAAALHVTGDLEAENVCALGLQPQVACIPNGLTVPAHYPARDPGASKRVVFLGRLHPIKGLPMLIEAWARIRPPDWALEIAGPDEDGHLCTLQAQVEALGLKGAVQFTGAVRGSEKQALLARANVFVLPSYSENFGLAAGEALAAGVPVIASKGTPWAALETEHCGWHVATSVDGLEAGLRMAFGTSAEILIAMGRRGHAYVLRTFSWRRAAEEMRQIYQRVLT